jgi:hypothetical protein
MTQYGSLNITAQTFKSLWIASGVLQTFGIVVIDSRHFPGNGGTRDVRAGRSLFLACSSSPSLTLAVMRVRVRVCVCVCVRVSERACALRAWCCRRSDND